MRSRYFISILFTIIALLFSNSFAQDTTNSDFSNDNFFDSFRASKQIVCNIENAEKDSDEKLIIRKTPNGMIGSFSHFKIPSNELKRDFELECAFERNEPHPNLLCFKIEDGLTQQFSIYGISKDTQIIHTFAISRDRETYLRKSMGGISVSRASCAKKNIK